MSTLNKVTLYGGLSDGREITVDHRYLQSNTTIHVPIDNGPRFLTQSLSYKPIQTETYTIVKLGGTYVGVCSKYAFKIISASYIVTEQALSTYKDDFKDHIETSLLDQISRDSFPKNLYPLVIIKEENRVPDYWGGRVNFEMFAIAIDRSQTSHVE